APLFVDQLRGGRWPKFLKIVVPTLFRVAVLYAISDANVDHALQASQAASRLIVGKASASSRPAWNGRVLIDATSPFVETSPKLLVADLDGKGASEVVAALAPGARIVKAFNSIVTARFKEGPLKNGGRRVIFVSGTIPNRPHSSNSSSRASASRRSTSAVSS